MVNDAATLGIDPADGDPLRALALGYAPADAQTGVVALFALDATFAGIVRRARDPLAAQLRLAWWDEALRGLDEGAPATQPVLAALAGEVLPRGVSGVELAGMIDGWERLLERDVGAAALTDYAAERGALFALADRVAAGGAGALLEPAGRGWALADLGRIVPAPGARDLAEAPLRVAVAGRWPSRSRFLSALVHAAWRGGSAGTVLRLLAHRLTGR